MPFSNSLALAYSIRASNKFGKDYWVVTEQFITVLDKENNVTITIPKGFLTDGASVPRVFWTLFPRWSKYGQAACAHDYMCEYLTVFKDGVATPITRKECDVYFLNLMEQLGISTIQRRLMYRAVATFRVLCRVDKPSFNRDKFFLELELCRFHTKYGKWI